MMLKRFCLAFLLTPLLIAPCWAHPGHGEPGLFHHIGEADPWLLALAGAVALYGIWRFIVRTRC